MPPRRRQAAPGAPLPPPPAPRQPKLVPRAEARRRAQTVELLLSQGFPVEGLAEVAAELLKIGPKAARRTCDRVLKGGIEAAKARALARRNQQNFGMVDAMMKSLFFYGPNDLRPRDVADMDVSALRAAADLYDRMIRRAAMTVTPPKKTLFEQQLPLISDEEIEALGGGEEDGGDGD